MIFNDNYLYIKYLGDGGFGRVALAQDVLSERLVAIKWLKETDTEKQKNIIHEIKSIANLGQPNIVTFYHHFMRQNNICLVMEYCENGSLRGILTKPILPSVALPWFEILCETLQYVHSKNIVHHDIKPDNILFTTDNDIKLSDFGISNRYAGTTPYMAPELFEHTSPDLVDPRTDIFALGVSLIEALTAKNPFIGKTLTSIKSSIINHELLIDNFPEWLQDIIYKSVNPSPALRFQTANEMAEAIKSQYVPAILDTKLLQSGRLASKATTLLNNKKWTQAYKTLSAALILQPDNLRALRAFGEYYLLQNNITEAKRFFEKLLHLNPRAEVHKEFGWIQLESGKHREAISLLNDYLQRNPNDTEAHNLLARCFYELRLFEQTAQYYIELIKIFPKVLCFKSNLMLSQIMLNILPEDFDRKETSPPENFIDYNKTVFHEKIKSWNKENGPSLSSKLLFQEHRFEKINLKTNTIEIIATGNDFKYHINDKLIPVGRWGYQMNKIKELESSSISRRHFILINSKNDIWLYNLSQTGTIVDGEKIMDKKFLHGLHHIRIGDTELSIKTDANLLL
jgi:serine/threonine protein kinase